MTVMQNFVYIKISVNSKVYTKSILPKILIEKYFYKICLQNIFHLLTLGRFFVMK